MTGLGSVDPIEVAFQEALFPRERLTPSEWAEKNRRLGEDESSEPGPYTFDRTPYLRGICDAVLDEVEEIVCLKGAQIGWSEACRNIFGYWVDADPGPCMILMPDQKSAEDFRTERIGPLVAHTPAVGRHSLPGRRDSTKHRIRFDTMSTYFVWAGSKAGTKSRPIRYLFCEEPDEYPPFSSTGGDPLAKAEKRLTTYLDKGRARKLIGGTPTTRKGNVWKRWELCTAKFHFWVPCPHCNGFQELHWKGVKWPDLKAEEPDRTQRAERIKSGGLAYYECEHCKEAIRDHHKPPMLRRGLWASEDQAVTRDGRIVGPKPTAKRIGFFLPSTYSPWVTFSALAEEWMLAQGDVQALCDFVNQRLAQPFEEQREKTEPTIFTDKAKNAPPARLVPAWAEMLIATADTQGNNDQDGYFWYVIRAWARGDRSQLVDFGVASSKAELVQMCLERPIAMEGGHQVTPQKLLVDSGGPRWSEVYELAQGDNRIHPTKGASGRQMWVVTEKVQQQHGVVLWMIDTEQAKDKLHRLIHDPDPGRWMPHAEINDDYASQMCSEAKVFDPQKNAEHWQEIVQNNNHLWDCESQQVAAAWKYGMGVPAPLEAVAAAMPTPAARPGNSFVRSHEGRY